MRIHVVYIGRVQGVGFRFTCERLAIDLGLNGWVSNLAGGQVELVCEGDQEQLERLLQGIDKQFSGYISKKDVNWMPETNEFVNFQIRL